MYQFGYYYHFPSNVQQDKQVVLLLQNSVFMFKEVDTDLIPFDKRFRTSAYYDLSMPVVCRLNGNTISEVVFLNDIPISNGNNEEGFSFEINIDKKRVVLNYNSKPFIDENVTDKRDLLFAHLLEELIGANKRISMLNEIISFITPNNRRSKDIITKELMYTLDSYDLNNILSSLCVTDDLHCHFKAGEGYDNTLYHTKFLTDKSVRTDEYINKIIGIGTETLDSGGYGYHNAGHVVYEGEKLEEEKKKILSRYSKIEHMAYLIFSKLEEKENAIIEREEWKEPISELTKRLESEFSLSSILELDHRFFYSDYKNTFSGQLVKINSLISRKMRKVPKKRVIISGSMPKKHFIGMWEDTTRNQTTRVLLEKIYSIIENLLIDYNVEIISGNADGAEHESLQYALENKLEFVNEYTTWTMLGKDRKIERYKEMVQMADVVYLTDFKDSYLYKNFISVANEFNVPVEIIK